MRYSEARRLIKSGDLIAYSGKAYISWAIRVWLGTSYSHVGIAMWWEWPFGGDTLWTVESIERIGVRTQTISGLPPFYWIPLPEGREWTKEAEEFVAARLGRTKYDWWAIIRRFMGWEMPRDEHYTCNEFAAEVISRCGEPFPAIPQSPGELVEFMQSLGAPTILVMPDEPEVIHDV